MPTTTIDAELSDLQTELTTAQAAEADVDLTTGESASASTSAPLSSSTQTASQKAAPLSSSTQNAYQKAGALLSTGTQWLMMPALTIVGYIGKLLENEFIFDSNKAGVGMDGMEGMLKEIWVLMRDIVNVLFVLVLLFVAFINVVKEAGSASGWELKAILPKIVIALVAVNFSWSACKVLIDVSNVATATVLAIPQSLDRYKEIEAETVDSNLSEKQSVLSTTPSPSIFPYSLSWLSQDTF